MNKKKIIAIKDPRLQAIRNNLREVISLAVYKEKGRIFGTMNKEDKKTAEGYERYCKMHAEMDKLSLVLEESTIQCPTCNFGSNRDVRYNPYDKTWYCVDCFKDMEYSYYITMAMKETGRFIGSDYDEEFARSFTEDGANIEHEIQKIKNAFQKIDVAPISRDIENIHAKTPKEVINDIINTFFIARVAEDDESFGEIAHLLAPFFKKLRESGLYEEYQKNITLVSIEQSGIEFGLLKA